MADFVLKVNTEALKQKAGEFTSIINEIQKHFDQIESISKRTKGYWKGDAGDKDRAGYSSYKDEITHMMLQLREHPDDLLKMAGLYEKAEKTVAATNTKLQTDLIV